MKLNQGPKSPQPKSKWWLQPAMVLIFVFVVVVVLPLLRGISPFTTETAPPTPTQETRTEYPSQFTSVIALGNTISPPGGIWNRAVDFTSDCAKMYYTNSVIDLSPSKPQYSVYYVNTHDVINFIREDLPQGMFYNGLLSPNDSQYATLFLRRIDGVETQSVVLIDLQNTLARMIAGTYQGEQITDFRWSSDGKSIAVAKYMGEEPMYIRIILAQKDGAEDIYEPMTQNEWDEQLGGPTLPDQQNVTFDTQSRTISCIPQ